jgi:integrase
MDEQNLQKNYPLLISYMEGADYSTHYIRRFRREIKHLLSGGKLKKWRTYKEIYLSDAKGTNSQSYLRDKRNVLGAIERFDLNGDYPNRSQRTNILRNSSYDYLSDEFKKVIDVYRRVAKQSGKKEAAIYTESHNATTFLLSLQRDAITLLSEITESAVLGVFFKNGKPVKGYSYRKNVAAVFKACIPFFPEDTCKKVVFYLPALREERRIIQYLTREEVGRIKEVLGNSDSPLCLRDKSIGLLAIYTGLRCCDIAGLTLEDIDWSKDRISIKQQKTGIPAALPLMATVGNAIYDYLTKERPQADCNPVFLTRVSPFTKLQSSSLHGIAKKIMEAAKIRLNPGDRQGFHLFRHYIVVSMLENDIPQPVISRLIGHASPSSLDAYLSADFSHLKECALSIEHFPLRKEVLS